MPRSGGGSPFVMVGSKFGIAGTCCPGSLPGVLKPGEAGAASPLRALFDGVMSDIVSSRGRVEESAWDVLARGGCVVGGCEGCE